MLADSLNRTRLSKYHHAEVSTTPSEVEGTPKSDQVTRFLIVSVPQSSEFDPRGIVEVQERHRTGPCCARILVQWRSDSTLSIGSVRRDVLLGTIGQGYRRTSENAHSVTGLRL